MHSTVCPLALQHPHTCGRTAEAPLGSRRASDDGRWRGYSCCCCWPAAGHGGRGAPDRRPQHHVCAFAKRIEVALGSVVWRALGCEGTPMPKSFGAGQHVSSGPCRLGVGGLARSSLALASEQQLGIAQESGKCARRRRARLADPLLSLHRYTRTPPNQPTGDGSGGPARLALSSACSAEEGRARSRSSQSASQSTSS